MILGKEGKYPSPVATLMNVLQVYGLSISQQVAKGSGVGMWTESFVEVWGYM